jgi:hypothetical protein
MNKKGSTSDMMFLAVLAIFAGMVLVLSLYLYNSFSSALRTDTEIITSGSLAEGFLDDYDSSLPTTFDTIFVIVFFGTALFSIVLAFLVRTSPLFAIFSIIIMIIMMVLVGALATMWDDFKSLDSNITSTINLLPMTSYVLDHLPLFLLGIWILIFLSMFMGGRL